MRSQWRFLLLLILCGSCSESFKKVDPTAFNASIKTRTDINSPEELVKLYYCTLKMPEQGISITTKKLAGNRTEITLINNYVGDDSVRGEKVVMIAEQVDGNWNVLEIRYSWQCHSGRGHTGWGTDACS